MSEHINENSQQANDQTKDQRDEQTIDQKNDSPLQAKTEQEASFAAPSEFTNAQIDSQHITTDTLTMVSLSPKYRTINLLINGFWGAVVLIIIAVVSSGLFFDIPEDARTFAFAAFGLVSFLTLWTLVHHWFADPLKQYALREHDLNFQSGLIFRRLVSQPLLRIQHIELKRGPIERKADLATLQVFSAGGVSHTFHIPGLEYDRAVELRQFILDHKDLASDV